MLEPHHKFRLGGRRRFEPRHDQSPVRAVVAAPCNRNQPHRDSQHLLDCRQENRGRLALSPRSQVLNNSQRLIASNDRSWRIVLKKSFWGDDQNFLGPLMRFSRGDMKDHIVSHQIDQGRSYRPYRALLREECLKIDFREIFEVVRFSTFSTVSAQSGTPGNLDVVRCEKAKVRRQSLRHWR
jgi:hypothetical protein